MNKTKSKARELLMNSRLNKINETEELKVHNSLNSRTDWISVDNTSSELAEKKSEHKSSENNFESKINYNLENIVYRGNPQLDLKENVNLQRKTDESKIEIINVKDTNNDTISPTDSKQEETNSLKKKLTDRLALFENKKNPIVVEKKINLPCIDNTKGDKNDVCPEHNRLIANKPNLLDRFNKNVNKGPVIVKQTIINEEKEIIHTNKEEKEEINNNLSNIKLNTVEQAKLMKRMISAKENKCPMMGKDLGKSKASEKIMGLASMLQNKLGPKESSESEEKNKFLLTNDADIQIINTDNKDIVNNEVTPEKNTHIEKDERQIIIERKSLTEILFEKPLYKSKTVKKRTQKVFQLKEEM